jgi:GNAT superfamily N-acetyltransferase
MNPLDNPVWHSLNGPHRHFALSDGDARWFPRYIAPFAAVPTAYVVPKLNHAPDGGVSNPVYFLGVIPSSLPDHWQSVDHSRVLQMEPYSPGAVTAGDIATTLTAADRPAMLALARRAFPDFFRERTAELGTYVGIFSGSELVAMAGERLALPGFQEISGVCTHPDYAGRGFARRLTRVLIYRQQSRGVATFLHVSEDNIAARKLYESLGFIVRASLPMAKVITVGSVAALGSGHDHTA